MDCTALMNESVWFNQLQHEQAEATYQLHLAGCLQPAESPITDSSTGPASKLVGEIAKARQNIQQSLESVGKGGASSTTSKVVDDLVKDNKQLRELVEKLSASVASLCVRVDKIEGKPSTTATTPATNAKAAAPAPEDDDDDDDDFDMFGSDDEEETAEAERIKAERIQAYNEKKASKKKIIAKSSLLIDVKPWDDETDMAEVERLVRTIVMDGLLWGPTAKLVPLAYGIKKLQIPCVIEDDKVSTDDLEEKIVAFEDLVQSMDIAAFNKV